ncbi:RNA polymerase sigma-70 factor [Agaribacillus aureus]|uniref:RNA polymerase sigma-70 factor n=1 Tax=Agaribacillus aureus TaxID=3051825 RepID=UPI003211BA34
MRAFLLQDDRRGLEILFNKYFRDLYRFAFMIVNRNDLSQDIVQEVFFKLWQIRYRLPEEIVFKPYLYKAVRNLALNKLKKIQRHDFIYDFPEDIETQQLDMSELLEVRDLKDKIRLAVQLLPPKCQLVFKLSRYEEMSYSEIAAHLDVSVKTVENQMGKALRRIRDSLKPYLDGY